MTQRNLIIEVSDPEINSGQAPQAMTVVLPLVNIIILPNNQPLQKLYLYTSSHQYNLNRMEPLFVIS